MKKVLISAISAGAAILLVSMTTNALIAFLSPGIDQQYQNTNLFRSWNDPVMSLYFLYPFVLGTTLAFFWNKTKQCFKGSPVKRAANFAWWFFLVATIPGMFITYSSFNISLEMVLVWSITGFVEVLAAGIVFGKLNS